MEDTITCNGVNFGDENLAKLSMAYGYAEAGVGDTLSSKRDQLYDQAVVAKEADFDETWDRLMADYLSAGAQDIMNEREEKWNEFFGSETMLP